MLSFFAFNNSAELKWYFHNNVMNHQNVKFKGTSCVAFLVMLFIKGRYIISLWSSKLFS